MSKKFNMDCAAERIVNKIYLKYREYIVDEFIKIDWSFFEDGDKEKILTDEDFFGLICEMLYEKMDYYDCYARDDYFYILRLDENTANVVANKLARTAYKNTTKGTTSGEIIPYTYVSVFEDKGMAIRFTHNNYSGIWFDIHTPFEQTKFKCISDSFVELVYSFVEMYLLDVLCITEEFKENVKKYQMSEDDARKKTNFLFENKCSIYK